MLDTLDRRPAAVEQRFETQPALGLTIPSRAASLAPTIFHEAWWLEAASSGRYAEVTVREGGRLVGRLPYVVNRRFGLSAIETPTLTHFLGPVIDAAGSAGTALLKSIRITRQLLDGLPPAQAFHQQLHRGCTEALAFQERGYDVLTQFTSEIAPRPKAALWSALRDKTRNVIRRAEERYAVEALADPGEFLAFYAANLDRRSYRSYYDLQECEQLGRACLMRGRGRFLVVRDCNRALLAGIFYAWDGDAAYFLMSSRDGRSADNGMIPSLIWQAVVDATSRGLVFDMDGFGHAGLVTLLAGFGGKVHPRFAPRREAAVYAAARHAGRALRRGRAAFQTKVKG